MSHIPNQIHQTWNSALLPEQGGTLHAAFHVATDGMLLEARNAERVALAVTVSRGSLVVEAPAGMLLGGLDFGAYSGQRSRAAAGY